ncbi:MAG: DUF86 domain-containing protein [Sulfurimonas sp.]|uniref:HepT-like ribonuclease domain-containing protein n=1 Tax=Sulfurimonas sp. TaxID=2022749 RepID=UPI002627F762|nr:DUF86 domain-containing protein [Sulfurimonas sp.]MDD5372820.1 DUF86 domain-containing protein [Sulfurimonas sp.]
MFNTNRDWKLYAEDILQECENIKKFTDGVTYEEFTENLEKVYAVAKAFENIGEAVKQLPKEITKNYPNIPWSEIAKMRDVLTHHYFGLDDKVLWDTLDEDFEQFWQTVEEISKS